MLMNDHFDHRNGGDKYGIVDCKGPCCDGVSAKCCQDPGRYFIDPISGSRVRVCLLYFTSNNNTRSYFNLGKRFRVSIISIVE